MTVQTNPADPRRLAARSASVALFSNYPGKRGPRSILADSLDGVDREQLYPAIRALLQHEDSVPRSAVGKTFERLNDRDLVVLLPDIVKAVEDLAPSNEMFGDGIRLAGLDLLSRLHIREGMALCLSVMEPERWGEGKRTEACLASLQRYGAHAKPLLPKLKEAREYLATEKRVSRERLAEFDQALAAIEASSDEPSLVRIADFQSRTAPLPNEAKETR